MVCSTPSHPLDIAIAFVYHIVSSVFGYTVDIMWQSVYVKVDYVTLVCAWDAWCVPLVFTTLGLTTEITTSIPVPYCSLNVASMYTFNIARACVFGPLWLITVCYLFWRVYNSASIRHFIDTPIGNGWSSIYIAWLISKIRQPEMATCTIRSQFNNCLKVENFTARNHTHAESARVRNNSSSFMDLFGDMTGLPTYFLQKSAADNRHGRDGCRTYHWCKDLSVPTESFKPPVNAVLCMVDVDMHMDDLPDLLSTTFQPVLISTFQPSSVAKSDGEYHFTFNSNNEVIYDVSGGAVYKHKVWTYGKDTVMATSRRFLNQHYHIYNVDRRRLDDHHELILLTPIKRIISPLISLDRWLGHSRLERLRVVESADGHDFLRLTVSRKDGMFRSTGKAEEYVSALIPVAQDDAIAGLARVGKNIELTVATIKTVIDKVDQATATILTEYHRHKRGEVCTIVYPVSESVHKFQFMPETYDPTAKPSLKPFMSPVMLGCYAPDKCKSNDEAAINGRVSSVKASDDVVVTPKMLLYMEEFAKLLVPVANKGHPVDAEFVYEKQNRPAQRQILDRASMTATNVVEQPIQSFQKSEAYGKLTDPRIISTVPGVNKLNYSKYVYAFTSAMRATKWYAFALKPIEIARRVMTLCMAALTACMTDLSRFDGRVSKVLRLLEHMVMIRFFAVQYHKELNELMASQKNQRAFTTFGVKYDTGESRASGSAETADFNSFDNAFMAYATYRNMGMSPQEAWDALGIYGGDDGVSTNINEEMYVKTCAEVGQVLEVETIKRGQIGVNFLSRYYGPEIWHGSMDSMCDVKRQLSKLHTTISLPESVTPLQKLSEKLYAYYLTDKRTPIIGDFATVLVNVFPELVPDQLGTLRGVAYYHAMVEDDVQYPNCDSAGGWMVEAVKKQLPNFDLEQFRTWLATVAITKNAADMLKPPMCDTLELEHRTKVPVVVNGDVVTPCNKVEKSTAKKDDKTSSSEKRTFTKEDLERMAKTPCKEPLGKCKFGTKCRFKHA